jgi:hypothetical protein
LHSSPQQRHFGAMTGLFFGALFAMAWWPWIFWSQAIGVAFVAAFAGWIIPDLPVQEEQIRPLCQKLDRLDLPGGSAGVMALVLFKFAWNEAVVVTWPELYVCVCLIPSFVFVAPFFYIEIYPARHPILPVAAFTWDIIFVFACMAVGQATFGILVGITLDWKAFQPTPSVDLLRHASSPRYRRPNSYSIGIMVHFHTYHRSASALTVGKIIGKFPTSYIMVGGQIEFLVTSILMAFRPPNSIYWSYFLFGTTIASIGIDISLPAAIMIFTSIVPWHCQGMGASIVMTIVNHSISHGLGFASTVETNISHSG